MNWWTTFFDLEVDDRVAWNERNNSKYIDLALSRRGFILRLLPRLAKAIMVEAWRISLSGSASLRRDCRPSR